jgi:Holliday junction resolvasome RuvABC endonuclease subunit
MKILALDLGTTSGWAVKNQSGQILTGTVSFKHGRFEGGGMRFLRFTQWLCEMDKAVDGLEAVYFEEVRKHSATDAAHVYGGFLAAVTAWCEENEVPYAGVPVGTIKRHATGKGNAKKDAMIEAAIKKGIKPADDNEADAFHLLDLILTENKGM